MRKALARIAVVAGGGLLFLVVFLLALLPGRKIDHAGSVYSVEPDGWRALYLLCEELGFPVGAWEDAPGELEGRGNALVLTELPDVAPGPAATSDEPLRSRDSAHYRRFVAEGGALVLLTDSPRTLEGLEESLGLSLAEIEGEGRVWPEARLELAGGETFELEPGAFMSWKGTALQEVARGFRVQDGPVADGGAGNELEPAEGNGLVVVARLPIGQGTLVLVGLARDVFENRALERRPDNALLFVRLLEELGARERLYFDHYALGAFEPPSRFELVLMPTLLPATLHLVAWCALFLMAAAWVGPFARDAEPLLVLSPLARARGQGGLLVRAGRIELVAGLLRRGLVERWCARAGLQARGGEADLVSLARGDARWLARARELVLGPPPADERELGAEARALSVLERELFRASSKSTGRRPRTFSMRSP